MNIGGQKCPIAFGLDLVGDTWTMLILRDANAGLTRFEQFEKNLGIAPTTLTRKLAALTDGGLLEKRTYSQRPPRAEYVLTKPGREFLPVLLMLGAWSNTNHAAERLNRLVDTTTGEEVTPVLTDARTGKLLDYTTLEVISFESLQSEITES